MHNLQSFVYTVKAFSFGPHGNLCTKNEQNEICKSKMFSTTYNIQIFLYNAFFHDSKPY